MAARKKTGKKARKKAAAKKASRKGSVRRSVTKKSAKRTSKKASTATRKKAARPRVSDGAAPSPAENPRPRETARVLYDISPPLTPEIAVFPGDTPLTRQRLYDMKLGHALTLSTLHTTVHAGAHADAPSHYAFDGRSMEAQDLDLYVGRCQVIEARWWPGQRLSAQDVDAEITCERVLIKTGSWADPAVFNADYAALSPDAVHTLADRGVKLVGVDVPSVDPPTSKALESHGACFLRDVSIIECLDLSGVPVGEYELIALPLRLVGFDASPVRAVLREL